MERYIEIYFNGNEYEVHIRWCGDGEQHESYYEKDYEKVKKIVDNFFNNEAP